MNHSRLPWRWRYFVYAIAILMGSFMMNCQEGIIGSEDDLVISGVSFSVDETYLMNNQMVARGRVKNTSRRQISSPWYVEGQFYTDNTYRTKLGGDNYRLNVPLSRNQEIFWELRFTGSLVNVNHYPYFRVSDLRAIYKE